MKAQTEKVVGILRGCSQRIRTYIQEGEILSTTGANLTALQCREDLKPWHSELNYAEVREPGVYRIGDADEKPEFLGRPPELLAFAVGGAEENDVAEGEEEAKGKPRGGTSNPTSGGAGVSAKEKLTKNSTQLSI